MIFTIPAPAPGVSDAISSGRLPTAAREDLEPLLRSLVMAWLPTGPKAGSNLEVRATRVVAKVLDWLEDQPGHHWQQRWNSWIGDGEQDWRPHPGSSGQGVKWESAYAISALIVTGTVRPSYPWLLSKRRRRLWADWATYHDTDLYSRIAQLTEAADGYRVTSKAISSLVMMSIVTGKSLSQLTGEDFLAARSAHHARGVNYHMLPTCWVFAKQAGLLAGDPPSLDQLVAAKQLTPAELVDRHGIDHPGIRAVFVEYLTEVSVGCDYQTLTGVQVLLVKNFWVDIQRHHPGIDTLALTAQQAGAWRARMRELPDGRPRKDWSHLMDRVRSFYNDISAWALEEPARWAPWVAPNPVPRRVVQGARQRNTRRQQAHFKQRTRTLAPWIPQLVASVAQALHRAERELAAATAVAPGEPFDVDGHTWQRVAGRIDGPGAYRLAMIMAIDPSGSRVSLTLNESQAFWTWAALEVLRHSVLRIEEVLELSHLSIRPFRKPTGEVVPLLQVAPSKTEEERVLPVSPALAHALSRIVQRHTARFGSVPVIARHDYFERSFSPPLPYLFQHHYSTGRGQVFSDSTIRKHLARAAERAGLIDTDGSLLRPTPHDFRRLFLTDLIANKLPIHIAAKLAGHRSLDTTSGYVAIYPQDVFDTYETFLARRRAERPSDEYRQPTSEELQVFAEHFGRRRVELGDCVRPYGSGCTHEHACLRCQFLTVHPGARPRLDTIETDLTGRIATATAQAWLGDVEQLRLTLTRLREKRDQLADLDDTPSDFDALLAAHPTLELPADLAAASSTACESR